MIIQEMPLEAWSNPGHLVLPQEILNDDWVLYHGTTSFYEASIEKNGLNVHLPSPINKAVVQRVVDCFERLNWGGNDNGGYSILNNFTLGNDYSYSNKPIYLGESYRRSLTFASEDFAGGEGCRGLHKCIQDLRSYLDEPKVQLEAHDQKLVHRRDENGKIIHEDYIPASEQELDWLRQELEELQPVEQYVRSIRLGHQYGIVYAIKLDETDIPNMRYTHSMGIVYSGIISPGKIIAKLIVKNERLPWGTDYQRLNNGEIWQERLSINMV